MIQSLLTVVVVLVLAVVGVLAVYVLARVVTLGVVKSLSDHRRREARDVCKQPGE